MPRSSAVGRHSIQRLRSTSDLLEVQAHAAATPSLIIGDARLPTACLSGRNANQAGFGALNSILGNISGNT